MKTIAVFMGAGSSKPFGFPLTKELLPLIKEELDSEKLFFTGLQTRREIQTITEKLSKHLNTLLPGFNSVDPEDLPLITDVLSLIDHSLSVYNSLLPSMTTQDLIGFRILLERAILRVLESKKPSGIPDALVGMTNWLISQSKAEGKSGGLFQQITILRSRLSYLSGTDTTSSKQNSILALVGGTQGMELFIKDLPALLFVSINYMVP